MARRLEAQKPYWEPGTAHGYHSITLGPLAQELVRRITGLSIGRFFAGEIARPYQVDVHIGLPTSEWHRVCATKPAQVAIQGRDGAGEDAPPAGRLAARVLSFGMESPTFVEVANDRRAWAAEIPSLNAFGSARGLARLYAACVGDVGDWRLLDPETIELATRPDAEGKDLILGVETRFGLSFQLPTKNLPFGGNGAFGHDGAGGSLAFGDADLGLGFAFVTDRMPSPPGADPSAFAVYHALLQCIDGAQMQPTTRRRTGRVRLR